VGIKLCYAAGADSIRAFLDSQLVVSQLNREYELKDDTMAAYIRWLREATGLLKHSLITHILQLENRQADALSKLASSIEDEKPKRIQWETLIERSIDPREIL